MWIVYFIHSRSRRDSLTWSYAITATAAASSYLLITDDDGVHLTSQADTYSWLIANM